MGLLFVLYVAAVLLARPGRYGARIRMGKGAGNSAFDAPFQVTRLAQGRLIAIDSR